MKSFNHKLKQLHYLFFILFFVVIGCKTSTTDPVPVDKYLVSSSLIGEYNKASLQTRANGFSGGVNNPLVTQFVNALLQYDIKAYKIIYKNKFL